MAASEPDGEVDEDAAGEVDGEAEVEAKGLVL